MTHEEFFKQAINIERAAEAAYRLLVDIVGTEGKRDAMEFFQQMVEYARQHREEITQKSGLGDDVPVMPLAHGTEVPLVTTEAIPDNLDDAMAFALRAEKSGLAFYENMANLAPDAEIRALAAEFADEERTHVLALERFMGLKPY